MLTVPLQAIPSQVVTATLGGQSCQIAVYERATGLFCDLSAAGVPVISGVQCQNMNRIVRDEYLGFLGDLLFVDTQGSSDPDYTGLGTRFVLVYLQETDVLPVAPLPPTAQIPSGESYDEMIFDLFTVLGLDGGNASSTYTGALAIVDGGNAGGGYNPAYTLNAGGA